MALYWLVSEAERRRAHARIAAAFAHFPGNFVDPDAGRKDGQTRAAGCDRPDEAGELLDRIG